MTLINQNSTVTHNGNGVTTTWPYTFIIPDEDSARVGLFDIASGALTEIPDTDYSITGINDDAGGEVEYPLVGSPISAAKRLVIWREVEYTQDTELTNQTPYYPVVLMAQLDRMVMQTQQLAAEIARAIKVTLGSDLTPDEFIADLQAAEAAAEASATAAAASQAAAAASASSIALPADPTPLYMLRRNAGDTAYEERSPTQVRADISAVGVIRRQIFTASGTYTPHVKMLAAEIICVGGGGQGGGYNAIGAASCGASGGGGAAGGISIKFATPADIGVSQVVTVGGAGSGAAGLGNSGGNTSVGALCIALGGAGGTAYGSGGTGADSTALGTGDITMPGAPGFAGQYDIASAGAIGGNGGSNLYGAGGRSAIITSSASSIGNTGSGYGAGGSGAQGHNGAVTTRIGGAGRAGLVIVIEYCSE